MKSQNKQKKVAEEIIDDSDDISGKSHIARKVQDRKKTSKIEFDDKEEFERMVNCKKDVRKNWRPVWTNKKEEIDARNKKKA